MISEKTAVAIKYSETADMPFITASEKGVLAEEVLKIAQRENIPIVQDKNLANVLSLQKIGSCIPEESWDAIAKIFAFIVRMEESL